MIIIHVRQTFDDARDSEYGTVTSALPCPLSEGEGGGVEKFSVLAKRVGLALFVFLGGSGLWKCKL